MRVAWIYLASIVKFVHLNIITIKLPRTPYQGDHVAVDNSLPLSLFLSLTNTSLRIVPEVTRKSFLLNYKYLCMQVINSGYILPIDETSCTLPSYCKHVEFTVLKNGWFGATAGLCRGSPGEIIRFQSDENTSLRLSDDFWQSYIFTLPKYKFANVVWDSYFHNSTFYLMRNHQNDEWMVMPQAAINLLPYFDWDSQKIIYPELHSIDGKYCSPRQYSYGNSIVGGPVFRNFRTALLTFPFPYYVSDLRNKIYTLTNESIPEKYSSYFFFGTNFMFNYFSSFNYTIDQYGNPGIDFQVNKNARTIYCDPYTETATWLSITYSWLSRIFSDLLITIWSWILVLIEKIITHIHQFIHAVNFHYYFIEYMLTFLAVTIRFNNIYVTIVLMILIYSVFGIARNVELNIPPFII